MQLFGKYMTNSLSHDFPLHCQMFLYQHNDIFFHLVFFLFVHLFIVCFFFFFFKHLWAKKYSEQKYHPTHLKLMKSKSANSVPKTFTIVQLVQTLSKYLLPRGLILPISSLLKNSH